MKPLWHKSAAALLSLSAQSGATGGCAQLGATRGAAAAEQSSTDGTRAMRAELAPRPLPAWPASTPVALPILWALRTGPAAARTG